MTFNFKPASYSTPPKYFPNQSTGEQPVDRTSYLGTPVFSNMEIPSGKYKTLDGKTIQFEGIRIDAVLFIVSQSKNIVTTAIQGQNGTVKEYVSDGDFSITVSGMIVGESNESGKVFTVADTPNNYPESDVRKLIEICKIPTSIEIVSEFLDFFEIRNVVIESFSFDQKQGDRRSQPFQIQMISDAPVELIEI